MDSPLTISEYSEKAFVVRGGNSKDAFELTKMHGKWNSRLKGGEGWIFSKKRLSAVQKFVAKVNESSSDESSSEENTSEPKSTSDRKSGGSKSTLHERYETKLRQKFRAEIRDEIRGIRDEVREEVRDEVPEVLEERENRILGRLLIELTDTVSAGT